MNVEKESWKVLHIHSCVVVLCCAVILHTLEISILRCLYVNPPQYPIHTCLRSFLHAHTGNKQTYSSLDRTHYIPSYRHPLFTVLNPIICTERPILPVHKKYFFRFLRSIISQRINQRFVEMITR